MWILIFSLPENPFEYRILRFSAHKYPILHRILVFVDPEFPAHRQGKVRPIIGLVALSKKNI